jgi:hypothetical protein
MDTDKDAQPTFPPLSSWSAAKDLISVNRSNLGSFAALQDDNSQDFSEARWAQKMQPIQAPPGYSLLSHLCSSVSICGNPVFPLRSPRLCGESNEQQTDLREGTVFL